MIQSMSHMRWALLLLVVSPSAALSGGCSGSSTSTAPPTAGGGGVPEGGVAAAAGGRSAGGVSGSAGATRSAGAAGASGSAGASGDSGSAGVSGSPGAAGVGGSAGSSGHAGNGGSAGSAGAGGTPCTGAVVTAMTHTLTSCGLTVSKSSSQSQFVMNLNAADATNGSLMISLAFNATPATTTYDFSTTNYAFISAYWGETTPYFSEYNAMGFPGNPASGTVSITFTTVSAPHTLADTEYYDVTGSISATLEGAPPKSAMASVTF